MTSLMRSFVHAGLLALFSSTISAAEVTIEQGQFRGTQADWGWTFWECLTPVRR